MILRRLKNSACQRPAKTQAFTLIELLAVMVIIGILLAAIIGIGNFAKDKACRSKATAELHRLNSALLEYKLNFDASFGTAWPYPQVADNKVTNLLATAVKNWLPAHFSCIDPWGNDYYYVYDAAVSRNSYVLYSKGNLNGLNDKPDDPADDIILPGGSL